MSHTCGTSKWYIIVLRAWFSSENKCFVSNNAGVSAIATSIYFETIITF